MTVAGLRLESFAAGVVRASGPTEADLERARQQGYELGAKDAVAARLDTLCAGLRQIGEQVAQLNAETTRVRHQTLESVMPLLNLVIDLLGPAHVRSALAERLGHELRSLGTAEGPDSLRIRCSPDLVPLVQECAEKAQITVEIEVDDAAESSVDICAKEGRLRFEPERMLERCRSLIQELVREE